MSPPTVLPALHRSAPRLPAPERPAPEGRPHDPRHPDRSRRRLLRTVSAMSALSLAPAIARAAGAPLPATVAIVVPFAPGGGADQLVRELADALRAALPDTTFVVENQPGANGALASRAFLRRKPDGSALLLGTSSTLALSAAAGKLDVDPASAFAPVSLLAETANALAVAAGSPWRTLADYLVAARAREISYASFGAGSSGHLYGLLLQEETGARLVHVPYKGSSPALNDLLGGHVDSAFLTTSAVETVDRDGRVRVLAVTGTQRSPNLPAVATFQEQGVRALDFNGWFGLFAPRDTPAAIVDALAAALGGLARRPAFATKMREQGYLWVGSEPGRMDEAMRRSLAVYRRIVEKHPMN